MSTTKTITVEAGDTLWDLAAKHLGNPYAWSDLYRANYDVILQAQRARGFTRPKGPDLIYAGTVLAMPQGK